MMRWNNFEDIGNTDMVQNFKALRRIAEERLRDKTGDVSGRGLDDIQKLIHELEVHQIELELQNEELRGTQGKLIESRDKYHELYDFAPVGYFTIDETALIRQVNLTGADILGLKRSKIVHTKFFHYISPDFQDEFYLHCRRVFEKGTKQTCALKMVKQGGTRFDVKLDSIAVKDGIGGSRQFRTTVTDTTELMKSREGLQGSEEKFGLMFNQMVSATALFEVIVNKGGKPDDYAYIEINPAFEKITGKKKGQVIGKTLLEVFPETELYWLEGFEEVVLSGISKEFENYHKGLDKYFRVSAFRPQEGQVAINFIDITDHLRIEETLQKANDELESRVEARAADIIISNANLRAEIEERRAVQEQLKESKAMLQAVFDGILEPLIMTDNDMRVQMLNRAASQYYGAVGIECIGKPCFEAFNGASEPCEGCRLISTLSTGKPTAFERKGFMNPKLDEKISIYPLHEKSGVVNGAIFRISDLTQKKEVEKQLMRADRLSSLGQLSGGIAHEIRNPLTGISLFVDILGDEMKYSRSDQELDIFQEIKINISKINSIITRILELAKSSHRNAADININNLIQETIRLWYANVRDIQIEVQLSLAANLLPVFGDVIGLQQLFNNIIQNGIEAMGKGGVLKITTYNGISSFHQDRKVVIIEIEDTGHGISAGDRDKIFDPFFTTKSTGTGLGLSISHQVIEHHGGIISHESEADRGTTFTIELPNAPEN
jgi:PAS domain S-box-containing protein